MTIIQGGVKISGFVQFTANYEPGPPTALTATWTSAVTNTVSLRFTPPVNSGSGPVTSYSAVSNPAGFTATVAANTNTVVIPGLLINTPYVFNMYSTNFAGNSSLSTSSNIIYGIYNGTPIPLSNISPPGAPLSVTAIVTATNVNPTPSALVSFIPGSFGGLAATTLTISNNPSSITSSTYIFGSTSVTDFNFSIQIPAITEGNTGYFGMGYVNLSTMAYTQAVDWARYSAYGSTGLSRSLINYSYSEYGTHPFRLTATKTGSSLIISFKNTSDAVNKTETIALSGGTNYKIYLFYTPDQITNTKIGSVITDTAGMFGANFPNHYYTIADTSGVVSITTTSNSAIISGLSPLTSYAFNVYATNIAGAGSISTSSNSITTLVASSSTAYTFPGTYSWIAPAGVTSVSAVVVGGGGGGRPGGSLAAGQAGNQSSFWNSVVLAANGGGGGAQGSAPGGTVAAGSGNAGGQGGAGPVQSANGAGGGAGGYTSVGGAGGGTTAATSGNGSTSGGGGGANVAIGQSSHPAGGGGVGLFGLGSAAASTAN